MMEIIKSFLKVKSLMTIAVSCGLIYGFIADKIDAAQFMTIAVMVFTFYFAKNDSSARNNKINKEPRSGFYGEDISSEVDEC